MNIEIDIHVLSPKKAKEFYIECWGKLYLAPEDSDEYQRLWDIVHSLERVDMFPRKDLHLMRAEARKNVGAPKMKRKVHG